jgi:quinol monooxygenase YgiN
MSIYLTAIIQSKPGHANELKELLPDLVDQSRKETACIQYDPHQSEDDENVFVILEEWVSAEGIASHSKEPHFTAFVENAKSLMAVPLKVYKTSKIG